MGSEAVFDLKNIGNITATGLTSSQIVETNASKQLISAAKGTAYNKSFAGSGSATTVARSDHGHPDYVTLNTTQTITGPKTIEQSVNTAYSSPGNTAVPVGATMYIKKHC